MTAGAGTIARRTARPERWSRRSVPWRRMPARAPERRLAAALEPVVGQVYFAPECHARYAALGFDPSIRRAGAVQLPDGPAYFASRGSLLGQVPGEVIAAAFAVFSPAVVVPAVRLAWQRTDAEPIRRARADGAVAHLRRLLGVRPPGVERARELLVRAAADVPLAGRPLAAGIASLPVPDEPLAAVWHLGDLLRELRGDSHTAAWVAAGHTGVEIGLLSESYWGLRLRSYSRTRGWTDAELDAAAERLEADGLIDAGGLTDAGRTHREAIEQQTDRQMTPVMTGRGDAVVELCDILEPWGATIRAGHGYLPAGPHDLVA